MRVKSCSKLQFNALFSVIRMENDSLTHTSLLFEGPTFLKSLMEVENNGLH